MFPSAPPRRPDTFLGHYPTHSSKSDNYALALSCWERPAAANDGQPLPESLTLGLAYSLLDLEGLIELLRLEFSSSPFTS
ncbi:hypothetical protein BDV11DRAFT_179290 [Aspergillus similis]